MEKEQLHEIEEEHVEKFRNLAEGDDVEAKFYDLRKVISGDKGHEYQVVVIGEKARDLNKASEHNTPNSTAIIAKGETPEEVLDEFEERVSDTIPKA